MKPALLLLPAALLLAACGAAPSSSSAVPAQSAAPAASASQSPETALETVAVTVDYSAYCDEAGGWLFRLEPDLYADPDCKQRIEIINISYDGSTGTYELALPAGTTDLYMARSPLMTLPEDVGEQTLPAAAGAACEDFTVQEVEVIYGSAPDVHGIVPQVIVKLDPASARFPDGMELVLADGSAYAMVGPQTSIGMDDALLEWIGTFQLKDPQLTMEQAEAALPDAELRWNTLWRYVQVTDAPCLTEGITLHWPGAE